MSESVRFKPSKDRYKLFCVTSRFIPSRCFKPSKDRYKPAEDLDWLCDVIEEFQTLKGSLQTKGKIEESTWSCRVSNPQRIATNYGGAYAFFPPAFSFKPSKDRYKQYEKKEKELLSSVFQTLKGSLQTGGFEGDIRCTHLVSNPQRIATNFVIKLRLMGNGLGFKPSKDRYKPFFTQNDRFIEI